MDRKQFLIKFWDNVLKPIFLLIIFIIIVKNFNQLIDIGRFLGALAGILIVLYLSIFILGYFAQEFFDNLPEKLKLSIKSLIPYLEKLFYLIWPLLIGYMIISWSAIPFGNKVSIITFAGISLIRFILKKIRKR